MDIPQVRLDWIVCKVLNCINNATATLYQVSVWSGGGWLIGQIVIQRIEFNYASLVVLALRNVLCADDPKVNADGLR